MYAIHWISKLTINEHEQVSPIMGYGLRQDPYVLAKPLSDNARRLMIERLCRSGDDYWLYPCCPPLLPLTKVTSVQQVENKKKLTKKKIQSIPIVSINTYPVCRTYIEGHSAKHWSVRARGVAEVDILITVPAASASHAKQNNRTKKRYGWAECGQQQSQHTVQCTHI